ncbi:type I methionyl aminopeptidase [Candidatus Magnetominusculus xianensis]|uniref:Methionine aminopeptidase n=1 Tax=Candidatus Magnetominusculus xianensis TaxID=1748249 RepID=A0ABR5SEN9_9BACT|nr:type I methionyl aminopeptidase [Candidatus Magnetominusculus xianensis]KWT83415.1 methionine aminopeptidase [Candidatus Magnetominusculus xianensis]MBF0403525.1 type I methionyl aminopeptidase [Nitrospirota bacterium]
MIIIKSDDEINKIDRASKIVAETLIRLGEVIAPGITTKDIELKAEAIIKSNKAASAFKGYRGYPASLCISVNNEVIHGIPSRKKVLKDGDIVSLDVGVVFDGYIGDAAWTYPVGKVSKETQKLLSVTKESLYKGIEKARANNRVSDISHSIQVHVEGYGYSVVRAFVGHGVGRSLHEEPQIPNYGLPNKGPRLKKGMVLAIEPMVNAGGFEVAVLKDGWTAVTADGSLSAHFEHTVVVTDDEPGILTQLN